MVVVIERACLAGVLVVCVSLTVTLPSSTRRQGRENGVGGDNLTVTNATNLSTTTGNENYESGRRWTVDSGMAPVYAATNFFLESMLRPRSVAALRLKVDLSDPRRIYESLRDDSAMWARHHIGFTMLVVVGILWAALMPIVGCVIVCWCRGDANRRRRRRFEGRRCCRCRCYTTCCRRTLAVLLGVACVLLLLGVATMMLANQLMCQQTLGGGLVDTFVSTVDRLESYRHDMTTAVRTAVDDSIQQGQQHLITKVDDVRRKCQQELDEKTGLPDLLDDLSTLVLSLSETARLFNDLGRMSKAMIQYTTAASRNLSALRKDIQFNLKLCSSIVEVCKTSLRHVNDLPTDIISGTVISFGDVAEVIGDLANGSGELQARLHTATQVYNGFLNMAIEKSRYAHAVIAVKMQALNLSVGVRRVMRNATKRVERVFALADYKGWVTTTLAPLLRRYGAYRSGVGIALCAVVLLPAAGCLVALHFGAWGVGATNVDAMLLPEPCCSRSKATSALIVTAATTMETGWLLVLATCALFLAGGMLHVDLCRHLVAPGADPDSAAVVCDAVGDWLNVSVDLRKLMDACAERHSLLTAFDLVPDEVVSIRRLSAPLRELLQTMVIHPSKSISFNVLDSEITGMLERLNTIFASLDFAAYRHWMSRVPGETEMAALAESMREASAAVQASGDAVIATSLARYSEDVSHQHALYVATVESYHRNLNATIDKLDAWADSINITSLLSRLTAVHALNETEVVRRSAASAADDVLRAFTAVIDDVRTAVLGRRGDGCRPVYEAIDASFGAVCVDYLYPFNAFWFIAGACCFILLPGTVLLALVLSRFYCRLDTMHLSHRVSLKRIRMGRQQRQAKRPSLPRDQHSVRQVSYNTHKVCIHYSTQLDMLGITKMCKMI